MLWNKSRPKHYTTARKDQILTIPQLSTSFLRLFLLCTLSILFLHLPIHAKNLNPITQPDYAFTFAVKPMGLLIANHPMSPANIDIHITPLDRKFDQIGDIYRFRYPYGLLNPDLYSCNALTQFKYYPDEQIYEMRRIGLYNTIPYSKWYTPGSANNDYQDEDITIHIPKNSFYSSPADSETVPEENENHDSSTPSLSSHAPTDFAQAAPMLTPKRIYHSPYSLSCRFRFVQDHNRFTPPKNSTSGSDNDQEEEIQEINPYWQSGTKFIKSTKSKRPHLGSTAIYMERHLPGPVFAGDAESGSDVSPLPAEVASSSSSFSSLSFSPPNTTPTIDYTNISPSTPFSTTLPLCTNPDVLFSPLSFDPYPYFKSHLITTTTFSNNHHISPSSTNFSNLPVYVANRISPTIYLAKNINNHFWFIFPYIFSPHTVSTQVFLSFQPLHNVTASIPFMQAMAYQIQPSFDYNLDNITLDQADVLLEQLESYENLGIPPPNQPRFKHGTKEHLNHNDTKTTPHNENRNQADHTRIDNNLDQNDLNTLGFEDMSDNSDNDDGGEYDNVSDVVNDEDNDVDDVVNEIDHLLPKFDTTGAISHISDKTPPLDLSTSNRTEEGDHLNNEEKDHNRTKNRAKRTKKRSSQKLPQTPFETHFRSTQFHPRKPQSSSQKPPRFRSKLPQIHTSASFPAPSPPPRSSMFSLWNSESSVTSTDLSHLALLRHLRQNCIHPNITYQHAPSDHSVYIYLPGGGVLSNYVWGDSNVSSRTVISDQDGDNSSPQYDNQSYNLYHYIDCTFHFRVVDTTAQAEIYIRPLDTAKLDPKFKTLYRHNYQPTFTPVLAPVSGLPSTFLLPPGHIQQITTPNLSIYHIDLAVVSNHGIVFRPTYLPVHARSGFPANFVPLWPWQLITNTDIPVPKLCRTREAAIPRLFRGGHDSEDNEVNNEINERNSSNHSNLIVRGCPIFSVEFQNIPQLDHRVILRHPTRQIYQCRYNDKRFALPLTIVLTSEKESSVLPHVFASQGQYTSSNTTNAIHHDEDWEGPTETGINGAGGNQHIYTHLTAYTTHPLPTGTVCDLNTLFYYPTYQFPPKVIIPGAINEDINPYTDTDINDVYTYPPNLNTTTTPPILLPENNKFLSIFKKKYAHYKSQILLHRESPDLFQLHLNIFHPTFISYIYIIPNPHPNHLMLDIPPDLVLPFHPVPESRITYTSLTQIEPIPIANEYYAPVFVSQGWTYTATAVEKNPRLKPPDNDDQKHGTFTAPLPWVHIPLEYIPRWFSDEEKREATILDTTHYNPTPTTHIISSTNNTNSSGKAGTYTESELLRDPEIELMIQLFPNIHSYAVTFLSPHFNRIKPVPLQDFYNTTASYLTSTSLSSVHGIRASTYSQLSPFCTQATSPADLTTEVFFGPTSPISPPTIRPTNAPCTFLYTASSHVISGQVPYAYKVAVFYPTFAMEIQFPFRDFINVPSIYMRQKREFVARWKLQREWGRGMGWSEAKTGENPDTTDTDPIPNHGHTNDTPGSITRTVSTLTIDQQQLKALIKPPINHLHQDDPPDTIRQDDSEPLTSHITNNSTTPKFTVFNDNSDIIINGQIQQNEDNSINDPRKILGDKIYQQFLEQNPIIPYLNHNSVMMTLVNPLKCVRDYLCEVLVRYSPPKNIKESANFHNFPLSASCLNETNSINPLPYGADGGKTNRFQECKTRLVGEKHPDEIKKMFNQTTATSADSINPTCTPDKSGTCLDSINKDNMGYSTPLLVSGRFGLHVLSPGVHLCLPLDATRQVQSVANPYPMRPERLKQLDRSLEPKSQLFNTNIIMGDDNDDKKKNKKRKQYGPNPRLPNSLYMCYNDDNCDWDLNEIESSPYSMYGDGDGHNEDNSDFLYAAHRQKTSANPSQYSPDRRNITVHSTESLSEYSFQPLSYRNPEAHADHSDTMSFRSFSHTPPSQPDLSSSPSQPPDLSILHGSIYGTPLRPNPGLNSTRIRQEFYSLNPGITPELTSITGLSEDITNQSNFESLLRERLTLETIEPAQETFHTLFPVLPPRISIEQSAAFLMTIDNPLVPITCSFSLQINPMLLDINPEPSLQGLKSQHHINEMDEETNVDGDAPFDRYEIISSIQRDDLFATRKGSQAVQRILQGREGKSQFGLGSSTAENHRTRTGSLSSKMLQKAFSRQSRPELAAQLAHQRPLHLMLSFISNTYLFFTINHPEFMLVDHTTLDPRGYDETGIVPSVMNKRFWTSKRLLIQSKHQQVLLNQPTNQPSPYGVGLYTVVFEGDVLLEWDRDLGWKWGQNNYDHNVNLSDPESKKQRKMNQTDDGQDDLSKFSQRNNNNDVFVRENGDYPIAQIYFGEKLDPSIHSGTGYVPYSQLRDYHRKNLDNSKKVDHCDRIRHSCKDSNSTPDPGPSTSPDNNGYPWHDDTDHRSYLSDPYNIDPEKKGIWRNLPELAQNEQSSSPKLVNGQFLFPRRLENGTYTFDDQGFGPKDGLTEREKERIKDSGYKMEGDYLDLDALFPSVVVNRADETLILNDDLERTQKNVESAENVQKIPKTDIQNIDSIETEKNSNFSTLSTPSFSSLSTDTTHNHTRTPPDDSPVDIEMESELNRSPFIPLPTTPFNLCVDSGNNVVGYWLYSRPLHSATVYMFPPHQYYRDELKEEARNGKDIFDDFNDHRTAYNSIFPPPRQTFSYISCNIWILHLEPPDRPYWKAKLLTSTLDRKRTEKSQANSLKNDEQTNSPPNLSRKEAEQLLGPDHIHHYIRDTAPLDPLEPGRYYNEYGDEISDPFRPRNMGDDELRVNFNGVSYTFGNLVEKNISPLQFLHHNPPNQPPIELNRADSSGERDYLDLDPSSELSSSAVGETNTSMKNETQNQTKNPHERQATSLLSSLDLSDLPFYSTLSTSPTTLHDTMNFITVTTQPLMTRQTNYQYRIKAPASIVGSSSIFQCSSPYLAIYNHPQTHTIGYELGHKSFSDSNSERHYSTSGLESYSPLISNAVSYFDSVSHSFYIYIYDSPHAVWGKSLSCTLFYTTTDPGWAVSKPEFREHLSNDSDLTPTVVESKAKPLPLLLFNATNIYTQAGGTNSEAINFDQYLYSLDRPPIFDYSFFRYFSDVFIFPSLPDISASFGPAVRPNDMYIDLPYAPITRSMDPTAPEIVQVPNIDDQSLPFFTGWSKSSPFSLDSNEQSPIDAHVAHTLDSSNGNQYHFTPPTSSWSEQVQQNTLHGPNIDSILYSGTITNTPSGSWTSNPPSYVFTSLSVPNQNQTGHANNTANSNDNNGANNQYRHHSAPPIQSTDNPPSMMDISIDFQSSVALPSSNTFRITLILPLPARIPNPQCHTPDPSRDVIQFEVERALLNTTTTIISSLPLHCRLFLYVSSFPSRPYFKVNILPQRAGPLNQITRSRLENWMQNPQASLIMLSISDQDPFRKALSMGVDIDPVVTNPTEDSEKSLSDFPSDSTLGQISQSALVPSPPTYHVPLEQYPNLITQANSHIFFHIIELFHQPVGTLIDLRLQYHSRLLSLAPLPPNPLSDKSIIDQYHNNPPIFDPSSQNIPEGNTNIGVLDFVHNYYTVHNYFSLENDEGLTPRSFLIKNVPSKRPTSVLVETNRVRFDMCTSGILSILAPSYISRQTNAQLPCFYQEPPKPTITVRRTDQNLWVDRVNHSIIRQPNAWGPINIDQRYVPENESTVYDERSHDSGPDTPTSDSSPYPLDFPLPDLIFPDQTLDVQFVINDPFPSMSSFLVEFGLKFEPISETECFDPGYFEIYKDLQPDQFPTKALTREEREKYPEGIIPLRIQNERAMAVANRLKGTDLSVLQVPYDRSLDHPKIRFHPTSLTLDGEKSISTGFFVPSSPQLLLPGTIRAPDATHTWDFATSMHKKQIYPTTSQIFFWQDLTDLLDSRFSLQPQVDDDDPAQTNHEKRFEDFDNGVGDGEGGIARITAGYFNPKSSVVPRPTPLWEDQRWYRGQYDRDFTPGDLVSDLPNRPLSYSSRRILLHSQSNPLNCPHFGHPPASNEEAVLTNKLRLNETSPPKRPPVSLPLSFSQVFSSEIGYQPNTMSFLAPTPTIAPQEEIDPFKYKADAALSAATRCDYQPYYPPTSSTISHHIHGATFSPVTKDSNGRSATTITPTKLPNEHRCSSSNLILTVFQPLYTGMVCTLKIKFVDQFQDDPTYGPKHNLFKFPSNLTSHTPDNSANSTPVPHSQPQHLPPPTKPFGVSLFGTTSNIHLDNSTFTIPPIIFIRCRQDASQTPFPSPSQPPLPVYNNDYQSTNWYMCSSPRLSQLHYCPLLGYDDRLLRDPQNGLADCNRVQAYPIDLDTTLCIAFDGSATDGRLYKPCSEITSRESNSNLPCENALETASTTSSMNNTLLPENKTATVPIERMAENVHDRIPIDAINNVGHSPADSSTETHITTKLPPTTLPPAIYNTYLYYFPHLFRYCSSCVYRLQCYCLGEPCDCFSPCRTNTLTSGRPTLVGDDGTKHDLAPFPTTRKKKNYEKKSPSDDTPNENETNSSTEESSLENGEGFSQRPRYDRINPFDPYGFGLPPDPSRPHPTGFRNGKFVGFFDLFETDSGDTHHDPNQIPSSPFTADDITFTRPAYQCTSFAIEFKCQRFKSMIVYTSSFPHTPEFAESGYLETTTINNYTLPRESNPSKQPTSPLNLYSDLPPQQRTELPAVFLHNPFQNAIRPSHRNSRRDLSPYQDVSQGKSNLRGARPENEFYNQDYQNYGPRDEVEVQNTVARAQFDTGEIDKNIWHPSTSDSFPLEERLSLSRCVDVCSLPARDAKCFYDAACLHKYCPLSKKKPCSEQEKSKCINPKCLRWGCSAHQIPEPDRYQFHITSHEPVVIPGDPKRGIKTLVSDLNVLVSHHNPLADSLMIDKPHPRLLVSTSHPWVMVDPGTGGNRAAIENAEATRNGQHTIVSNGYNHSHDNDDDNSPDGRRHPQYRYRFRHKGGYTPYSSTFNNPVVLDQSGFYKFTGPLAIFNQPTNISPFSTYFQYPFSNCGTCNHGCSPDPTLRRVSCVLILTHYDLVDKRKGPPDRNHLLLGDEMKKNNDETIGSRSPSSTGTVVSTTTTMSSPYRTLQTGTTSPSTSTTTTTQISDPNLNILPTTNHHIDKNLPPQSHIFYTEPLTIPYDLALFLELPDPSGLSANPWPLPQNQTNVKHFYNNWELVPFYYLDPRLVDRFYTDPDTIIDLDQLFPYFIPAGTQPPKAPHSDAITFPLSSPLSFPSTERITTTVPNSSLTLTDPSRLPDHISPWWRFHDDDNWDDHSDPYTQTIELLNGRRPPSYRTHILPGVRRRTGISQALYQSFRTLPDEFCGVASQTPMVTEPEDYVTASTNTTTTITRTIQSFNATHQKISTFNSTIHHIKPLLQPKPLDYCYATTRCMCFCKNDSHFASKHRSGPINSCCSYHCATGSTQRIGVFSPCNESHYRMGPYPIQLVRDKSTEKKDGPGDDIIRTDQEQRNFQTGQDQGHREENTHSPQNLKLTTKQMIPTASANSPRTNKIPHLERKHSSSSVTPAISTSIAYPDSNELDNNCNNDYSDESAIRVDLDTALTPEEFNYYFETRRATTHQCMSRPEPIILPQTSHDYFDLNFAPDNPLLYITPADEIPGDFRTVRCGLHLDGLFIMSINPLVDCGIGYTSPYTLPWDVKDKIKTIKHIALLETPLIVQIETESVELVEKNGVSGTEITSAGSTSDEDGNDNGNQSDLIKGDESVEPGRNDIVGDVESDHTSDPNMQGTNFETVADTGLAFETPVSDDISHTTLKISDVANHIDQSKSPLHSSPFCTEDHPHIDGIPGPDHISHRYRRQNANGGESYGKKRFQQRKNHLDQGGIRTLSTPLSRDDIHITDDDLDIDSTPTPNATPFFSPHSTPSMTHISHESSPKIIQNDSPTIQPPPVSPTPFVLSINQTSTTSTISTSHTTTPTLNTTTIISITSPAENTITIPTIKEFVAEYPFLQEPPAIRPSSFCLSTLLTFDCYTTVYSHPVPRLIRTTELYHVGDVFHCQWRHIGAEPGPLFIELALEQVDEYPFPPTHVNNTSPPPIKHDHFKTVLQVLHISQKSTRFVLPPVPTGSYSMAIFDLSTFVQGVLPKLMINNINIVSPCQYPNPLYYNVYTNYTRHYHPKSFQYRMLQEFNNTEAHPSRRYTPLQLLDFARPICLHHSHGVCDPYSTSCRCQSQFYGPRCEETMCSVCSKASAIYQKQSYRSKSTVALLERNWLMSKADPLNQAYTTNPLIMQGMLEMFTSSPNGQIPEWITQAFEDLPFLSGLTQTFTINILGMKILHAAMDQLQIRRLLSLPRCFIDYDGIPTCQCEKLSSGRFCQGHSNCKSTATSNCHNGGFLAWNQEQGKCEKVCSCPMFNWENSFEHINDPDNYPGCTVCPLKCFIFRVPSFLRYQINTDQQYQFTPDAAKRIMIAHSGIGDDSTINTTVVPSRASSTPLPSSFEESIFDIQNERTDQQKETTSNAQSTPNFIPFNPLAPDPDPSNEYLLDKTAEKLISTWYGGTDGNIELFPELYGDIKNMMIHSLNSSLTPPGDFPPGPRKEQSEQCRYCTCTPGFSMRTDCLCPTARFNVYFDLDPDDDDAGPVKKNDHSQSKHKKKKENTTSNNTTDPRTGFVHAHMTGQYSSHNSTSHHRLAQLASKLIVILSLNTDINPHHFSFVDIGLTASHNSFYFVMEVTDFCGSPPASSHVLFHPQHHSMSLRDIVQRVNILQERVVISRTLHQQGESNFRYFIDQAKSNLGVFMPVLSYFPPFRGDGAQTMRPQDPWARIHGRSTQDPTPLALSSSQPETRHPNLICFLTGFDCANLDILDIDSLFSNKIFTVSRWFTLPLVQRLVVPSISLGSAALQAFGFDIGRSNTIASTFGHNEHNSGQPSGVDAEELNHETDQPQTDIHPTTNVEDPTSKSTHKKGQHTGRKHRNQEQTSRSQYELSQSERELNRDRLRLTEYVLSGKSSLVNMGEISKRLDEIKGKPLPDLTRQEFINQMIKPKYNTNYKRIETMMRSEVNRMKREAMKEQQRDQFPASSSSPSPRPSSQTNPILGIPEFLMTTTHIGQYEPADPPLALHPHPSFPSPVSSPSHPSHFPHSSSSLSSPSVIHPPSPIPLSSSYISSPPVSPSSSASAFTCDTSFHHPFFQPPTFSTLSNSAPPELNPFSRDTGATNTAMSGIATDKAEKKAPKTSTKTPNTSTFPNQPTATLFPQSKPLAVIRDSDDVYHRIYSLLLEDNVKLLHIGPVSTNCAFDFGGNCKNDPRFASKATRIMPNTLILILIEVFIWILMV